MQSPVAPGQILAGKYRVERILGVGGMGVVVAAVHVQLDEHVALKFLLPEFAQNQDVVARFLREGRAAVKIRSEHVARVSDVGTLDNGSPYIVMEYLRGSDLAAHLQESGRLPVEEAVGALLQACEALAEAHVLGIVHRDLKPANLFITTRADGSRAVKVLDFGISKVTQGADAALTKTSSMMGSPLYMSPEQMASAKDVDGRSDIWSLGVILYELVCGRPPFQGESIPQVCAQILQANPEPLSRFGVDRPGLQGVIDCCLAKHRDGRFADVAQFAAALAPFAPESAHLSIQRVQRIVASASAVAASIAPARPSQPVAGTIAMTPAPVASSSASSPVVQPTIMMPPAERAQPPRVVTTAGGVVATASTSDDHEEPFARPSRPRWLLPALGGGALFALVGLIYVIASPSAKKELATTVCNAVQLSGKSSEPDPKQRVRGALEWALGEVSSKDAKRLLAAVAQPGVDPEQIGSILREGAHEGGYDGACALADAYDAAYPPVRRPLDDKPACARDMDFTVKVIDAPFEDAVVESIVGMWRYDFLKCQCATPGPSSMAVRLVIADDGHARVDKILDGRDDECADQVFQAIDFHRDHGGESVSVRLDFGQPAPSIHAGETADAESTVAAPTNCHDVPGCPLCPQKCD